MPRHLHTSAWKRLLDHVGDTDHTGARIVNVIGRADVQAMSISRRIMRKKGGTYLKSHTQIYLLALTFLIYWSWPSISFITGLLNDGTDIFCKTAMKASIKCVEQLYADFCVRDGMLAHTGPGLRVVGRDKDRGWSIRRLYALVEQLPNWQLCASGLSAMICGRRFKVSEGMKVIQQYEMEAFSGEKRDYGSIGLIRCLCEVFKTHRLKTKVNGFGSATCLLN